MKNIIICVDDEKIVLDSLKSQLSRNFGSVYDFEFAESASDALEIIQEMTSEGKNIAAVISDWLMPGMKGDKLLELIHAEMPQVKKILLTGHVSNEVVQKIDCCNKSIINCIYKPWKEQDLVEILSNNSAT